jgi:DNA-binding PadR family transcriptional regulator
MTYKGHGCGPRGRIEIDLPEALMAMRGGRGWQGGWGPFHFDFGDEESGWGGGRRRRRTQLGSEDLRLLLLFLIAEKPRHGYDLIKAVEQLSEGTYVPSPGVVYPTLTMLQDMGHIEELPGEGSRKTYQATDEGRAFLEERGDQMSDVLERLDTMGEGRRRTNAGPVLGRAVKNVMTALSHRIGRDGLNEELLHEIAAVLDEAAQRIERVK